MISRYGSLLIFSDSPHMYALIHAEKLRYVCQHAVGLIEFGIIGTYPELCHFSIIFTWNGVSDAHVTVHVSFSLHGGQEERANQVTTDLSRFHVIYARPCFQHVV